VGLKNYQTLFQDPAFWKSLLVTLEFMLLALPPFLALSLVLAVVLDGLPYERIAKASSSCRASLPWGARPSPGTPSSPRSTGPWPSSCPSLPGTGKGFGLW